MMASGNDRDDRANIDALNQKTAKILGLEEYADYVNFSQKLQKRVQEAGDDAPKSVLDVSEKLIACIQAVASLRQLSHPDKSSDIIKSDILKKEYNDFCEKKLSFDKALSNMRSKDESFINAPRGFFKKLVNIFRDIIKIFSEVFGYRASEVQLPTMTLKLTEKLVSRSSVEENRYKIIPDDPWPTDKTKLNEHLDKLAIWKSQFQKSEGNSSKQKENTSYTLGVILGSELSGENKRKYDQRLEKINNKYLDIQKTLDKYPELLSEENHPSIQSDLAYFKREELIKAGWEFLPTSLLGTAELKTLQEIAPRCDKEGSPPLDQFKKRLAERLVRQLENSIIEGKKYQSVLDQLSAVDARYRYQNFSTGMDALFMVSPAFTGVEQRGGDLLSLLSYVSKPARLQFFELKPLEDILRHPENFDKSVRLDKVLKLVLAERLWKGKSAQSWQEIDMHYHKAATVKDPVMQLERLVMIRELAFERLGEAEDFESVAKDVVLKKLDAEIVGLIHSSDLSQAAMEAKTQEHYQSVKSRYSRAKKGVSEPIVSIEKDKKHVKSTDDLLNDIVGSANKAKGNVPKFMEACKSFRRSVNKASSLQKEKHIGKFKKLMADRVFSQFGGFSDPGVKLVMGLMKKEDSFDWYRNFQESPEWGRLNNKFSAAEKQLLSEVMGLFTADEYTASVSAKSKASNKCGVVLLSDTDQAALDIFKKLVQGKPAVANALRNACGIKGLGTSIFKPPIDLKNYATAFKSKSIQELVKKHFSDDERTQLTVALRLLEIDNPKSNTPSMGRR
jgi:hypothetical protein